MSAYQSNPTVQPARIPVLRHRRFVEDEQPVPTVVTTMPAPSREPTYADFIGGPVDTRTTYATQLDQVS